jgi:hypothetical protein
LDERGSGEEKRTDEKREIRVDRADRLGVERHGAHEEEERSDGESPGLPPETDRANGGHEPTLCRSSRADIIRLG